MKFHDELNSKLWDGEELKSEVADKLDEIATAFIEYLNIPLDSIEDIRITGSSANYNYTPQSDLDLHLIVDYEKVHEDCPIVEGYLWSMKAQFNKDHDISIYGVPVELYAEDSRVPAMSNGVYSLVDREWIKFPEKIEPTDNDAAVQAKYQELKEASERINDSEVAEELLDKIYAMRKAGLAEGGEFSTENMAFKLLRNAGIIDKLKQLKKEKVDKELTLEVANEIITINSADIKEPIKDFYKNNIQGKTIIHPTLGKILFTGIGLGETRNRVRGKYLDILSKIDTIVLTGNSDGIMEELTHPRNDNIVGFYLITNEVILNDKHLAVKVKIAVDNDGNKYYVFKTKSIKETIDSEPQLQSLKRPLRGKINSSTSIITENYNNFNTAAIILGDSIYIDILNELNESNNGHICLKLRKGKNNYGFAGIRNNELYTDYSSNDCTKFNSMEEAKPVIDRYVKAGFTVTMLGTGKFSYLNDATRYKFESKYKGENMSLKDLREALQGLTNSMTKQVNEMKNGEHEYIAPFFHGFYESMHLDTNDLEYRLFDDPSSLPEEFVDWCVSECEVADGYYDMVGKEYLDIIDAHMDQYIPAWGKSQFVEVDSPQYYNYTTDKVVGKIDITEELNKQIVEYLNNNKEAFKKWVKDNHSSYDGFTSFYSNDSDEWMSLDDFDHNELGSIIGFILENEEGDEIGWVLNEETYEIIGGTQWEVDMDELNKEFNFVPKLESLYDVDNYEYNEETNTFEWAQESPGQLKLQLESKMNEISDEVVNKVAAKRLDNETKAYDKMRNVMDRDKAFKAGKFYPEEKEYAKAVRKKRNNSELLKGHYKKKYGESLEQLTRQLRKFNEEYGLPEDVEAQVKTAIDNYISTHGDSFEIYVDYRDTLDRSSIKKIFESDRPAEYFYEYIGDFDWWESADYEYDEILKQFDLPEEIVEEHKYEILDMIRDRIVYEIPYDHYNETVGFDVFLNNPEEANIEYGAELIDYNEDGTVYGFNGEIVKLLQLQGYTEEDLVTYVNDKQSGNKFFDSILVEIENCTYDTGNQIVFLVQAPILDMARAIEDKGTITIPAGAVCGLHNAGNGSGSMLEIELEKDITGAIVDMTKPSYQPREGVFEVFYKDGYRYNVDEVYGLVASAWFNNVEFAQPQKEEKQESLNLNKSKKIREDKESDLSRIADRLEDGFYSGNYPDWGEVDINGTPISELIKTYEVREWVLRQISYPVRDGYDTYVGLDMIFDNYSQYDQIDHTDEDVIADLIALGFDEALIREMPVIEDDSYDGDITDARHKEIETWIDYDINYVEPEEDDDEEDDEEPEYVEEWQILYKSLDDEDEYFEEDEQGAQDRFEEVKDKVRQFVKKTYKMVDGDWEEDYVEVLYQDLDESLNEISDRTIGKVTRRRRQNLNNAHKAVDKSRNPETVAKAIDAERKMRKHYDLAGDRGFEEIDVFAPESEEYKQLKDFADKVAERLPSAKVEVENTWFDYGQKWEWTTVLITLRGDKKYQALTPSEQETILLGEPSEIDAVIDRVVKQAQDFTKNEHCIDRNKLQNLRKSINEASSRVSENTINFMNKIIHYGNIGWSDANTFVIDFGDGELTDEWGDDYFIHVEYYPKELNFIMSVWYEDDNMYIDESPIKDDISNADILALKSVIYDELNKINESKINEEVSNWVQHDSGLVLADRYIQLVTPIDIEGADLDLVALIFQNKKDAEFKFGYELSVDTGADTTLLSEGSSDYLPEIIDLCLGAIKEFDEKNNTEIIYNVKPLEPSKSDMTFLQESVNESKINEISDELVTKVRNRRQDKLDSWKDDEKYYWKEYRKARDKFDKIDANTSTYTQMGSKEYQQAKQDFDYADRQWDNARTQLGKAHDKYKNFTRLEVNRNLKRWNKNESNYSPEDIKFFEGELLYGYPEGSGRIELGMTADMVDSICTVGSNDAAVEAVKQNPEIRQQLDEIPEEYLGDLYYVLDMDRTEFDALTRDELESYAVWLAAWDIRESEEYASVFESEEK